MSYFDELTAAVIRCLGSVRVDLSDEKRAQSQIADALCRDGISFDREVRLAPGDVVDFMVGGLAVEVKLKGAQKRAVFRQLLRYAKHDCVHGLILVTNLSMGLPRRIDGKPSWYVSLGRAWL